MHLWVSLCTTATSYLLGGILRTMGSKASAGRERGVQQQEINVNLQRRQLMRVEPPLCYCHPKKIPPRISMVKTHCNPLYPPGCCSCPPSKKKILGYPCLPLPQSHPSEKHPHPLAFARIRPPLPAVGGRVARWVMLFVPGASRRRFCLLARLGLQCSPSKRSRSMNSPSSGGGRRGGTAGR